MAKVGRPNNIQSPEHMWELFQAYKKHAKQKPIIVKDWVGAMATEVAREKERPLTMEGFECFVWDQGVSNGIDHYFSNQGGAYDKFLAICSRIKKEIRQDQISGGMAGIYNPSITQRLNGLVEKTQADDKKEMTIKVKYEQDSPSNE